MDPELKEIGIWGGGALVVVLLGWYYLHSLSAGVAELNQSASESHAIYEKFYKEDRSGRLSKQRALQLLEDAERAQKAELQEVERRVLLPRPEGKTVPLDGDYTEAITWAVKRIVSLENRAEAMNLPFVKDLPYKKSGSLAAQDPRLRRIQLLQIYAYDLLLRRLMDTGPNRIESCAVAATGTDGNGAYLTLPVEVTLSANYEVMNRILEEFRDGSLPEGGMLNLEQINIERRGEQQYQIVLLANLITRNAGEKQAAPAGATGRPRSGGGTGSNYRTVPAPSAGGTGRNPSSGRGGR